MQTPFTSTATFLAPHWHHCKPRSFIMQTQHGAYAPQPNWGFNADTNSGHAFGIFMPAIGTLQPSASGAG